MKLIVATPAGQIFSSLNAESWWYSSENQRLPTSSRFLDNQRLIRSTLMYWFGRFPPDVSQRKLWMIASSSEQHRIKVDQQIAQQFESIIIEAKYQDWCSEVFGYQGKLATIIVLDQLARHIHRHYSASGGAGECAILCQAELDKLAYAAAEKFSQEHKQEIACGMIPLPMVIFALMPYRHASTLETVQFVQDRVEELDSTETQFDAMLRRFRKATNRRVALLQDEARRTGNGERTKSCSDIDILECFPFDADMDPARDHLVHKTIVEFLDGRGIKPTGNRESQPVPVVVSLSGGVDSMIIVSVLAHLARDCKYNIKIYAIHIDYANRLESGAEAGFVQQYCEDRDVTFCLRKIDEVTRGLTARDEYERIAREARYACYRETVQLCKDNFGDSAIVVGVMLGHHRGDLRENVLSNSHKGCGPLDLSGMTAVSINDRVVIHRPLLVLEKTAVLDYAHKFGVPYFKDTTPHWSTRGKLRNKLLPLLEEIYGEGSMNNLSNLAVESDQARGLLHDAVLGPFLEQVEKQPLGIVFATKPWKSQGLFFWKFVLREALHRSSFGMFSDKSVENFLERVANEKVKEGWLQCRRDYAVFLRADGKVFVLFPDSFPFRRAEQFDCVGNYVQYGEDVRIGPWLVAARIVTTGMDSDQMRKKAVESWEAFMSGDITYYLNAPMYESVVPPLVFVSGFEKQSRPLAWKSTDLKLQSTLPLLGNDKESVQLLANGAMTKVVEVRLRLIRI
eukprot:CAMPEP_0119010016 /NCGR_PEP_ID=MMETSP1176-20130426/4735_1 /TAXON_ID=265551 /ORGANISM="Synedropsis recta cf, Strain CCMP1620" /LENGTH=736 /DNA_ID=CAMNT_0006962609 /DNA_START=304 /DNA_END=2514 /DNA_ORIENTATION=+